MSPDPDPRASTPSKVLGRFLISGVVNTAITYLIYLALLSLLGHRLAYSAAFACGLVLAYLLNRHFVFKKHDGVRSVLAMPVIYALQYGVGLVIVEAWVVVFEWPPALAPLAAIAATVPMTYLLSHAAFMRRPG